MDMKATIREIVSRVDRIAAEFQIASLGRQISACKALQGEEACVDVVVIGQFKSGKSSFLNSLVGRDVLPVGVIPVTTAITRLQYGEEDKAAVVNPDASSLDITLADVASYTSEAENPSNQKGIAAVDVFLPSIKRYAGLRLIDTPGLGSVFAVHRDISHGILPEIGAAVLAVSSDRPLAEGDLSLLREMRRHTPRIVLLLTKVDLIDTEQREQMVDFFRKTLRRELGSEFPIFFYSDRQDTENHRLRLDCELLVPLVSNKASAREHILVHKTRHLAQSCLDYLRIALKASEAHLHGREELLDRVIDEKLNGELLRQELTAITRDHASKTRVNIVRQLEKFRPSVEKSVLDRLNRDLPSWSGNLWRLSRKFEGWIEEQMTTEMRELSELEHPHFYGPLNQARLSLERALRSFRALLEGNVERVLGIRLSKSDCSISVSEPARPDIHVGHLFDIQIDLLWFLIPMTIFRGLIEQRFRREIPSAVETNLSRLASQWDSCINEAIEGMRKEAVSYIEQEIRTIEAMLSKPYDEAGIIRNAIEELETLMQAINTKEKSS